MKQLFVLFVDNYNMGADAISEGRAALLIIDNAQGVTIGKQALECVISGERSYSLFPDTEGLHIPAWFLNLIGLARYYPVLESGYDDVYIVLGRDNEALLSKLSDATTKYENVDFYAMAHTNVFDGSRLAGVPIERYLEVLSPTQRKNLRFLYSMGCGDGNLLSAMSLHHLGFEIFLGHEGTSPNFLFTGNFLDRWVSGSANLSDAATGAYEDVKQELSQLPPLFFCAIGSRPSIIAEEIKPFYHGPDILFRDFASAPNDTEDTEAFFDDLAAMIVGGDLHNDGPGIRRSIYEYEPQLVNNYLSDMHKVHEEEIAAIRLLGTYKAREHLKEIACNPSVSILTRFNATNELSQLNGGIEDLFEIIKDPSVTLEIRKKAVECLYEAGAAHEIRALLAQPESTDPEILCYTAWKAERTHYDPVLEKKIPYSFASDLLPYLEALTKNQKIHPKIVEAALTSIEELK